jgi:two-component system sensor histidine kinase/response regulator
VQAADRTAKTTGEPFLAEYRHRTQDGKWVWLRDEAVRLPTSPGQPEDWQGVLVDVTAVKEAEAALRSSEERFRRAFEDAPIGMAEVGLDRHCLRVNRALCVLLDRPTEWLVGRSTAEVTHPDDLFGTVDHLSRLLAGEVASFQVEKRYLHHAEHAVPILLSVSWFVMRRERRPTLSPSSFTCPPAKRWRRGWRTSHITTR